MKTSPGTWVRLVGAKETLIGFVYWDPQAGLSAKGDTEANQPPGRAGITVRLPNPAYRVETLAADDIVARGLPARPDWLAAYGPQPRAWGAWLDDPRLADRFHPDYPNDIEVLFVDASASTKEKMWVSLVDRDPSDGSYVGTLLNQPSITKRVRQGQRVTLRVTPGAREPVFVGDVEADNLRNHAAACQSCGCDLLFEPAGALAKRQFGELPGGATMQSFTTRCGLCAGPMIVTVRNPQPNGSGGGDPARPGVGGQAEPAPPKIAGRWPIWVAAVGLVASIALVRAAFGASAYGGRKLFDSSRISTLLGMITVAAGALCFGVFELAWRRPIPSRLSSMLRRRPARLAAAFFIGGLLGVPIVSGAWIGGAVATEKREWARATIGGSSLSYRSYLRFADGMANPLGWIDRLTPRLAHLEEASRLADELAFDEAKKARTIHGYRLYVQLSTGEGDALDPVVGYPPERRLPGRFQVEAREAQRQLYEQRGSEFERAAVAGGGNPEILRAFQATLSWLGNTARPPNVGFVSQGLTNSEHDSVYRTLSAALEKYLKQGELHLTRTSDLSPPLVRITRASEGEYTLAVELPSAGIPGSVSASDQLVKVPAKSAFELGWALERGLGITAGSKVCPQDTDLRDGRCVARGDACPFGFFRDGKLCYRCQDGWIHDTKRSRCVSCTSGYTFNPERGNCYRWVRR